MTEADGFIGRELVKILVARQDAVQEASLRAFRYFRSLLVLREVEGLSYRELSDVLDIPKGTVMSRLSRARTAFRARPA